MLTAEKLNNMEYDIKHGAVAVIVYMELIADIRSLMAENMDLCTNMDKIKATIDDAIKTLNEVLK